MDTSAPYRKIVNALRADILTGRLQPGDRIPSRAELAEQYDVAPMTVQNALRALKEEGLIYGEKGRGVFVTTPTDDEVDTSYGYERVALEEHVVECNTCGALVRPEKWGRHLAWHLERGV